MWKEGWNGQSCHYCNLTIAIGEKRDHIGNFWFHIDETKNCLTKYLQKRHAANEAYRQAHNPPPGVIKHNKGRFRKWLGA